MSLAEWIYSNPVRIVFAPGSIARIPEHVTHARIVLVTSAGFTRRGVVARLQQALGDRLVHVLDDVKPNPDLQDIDEQAARIGKLQPDCILALGGGSSMDTAKALARILTQPEAMTLATHFRDGEPFTDAPALPVVTLPTTSGTGAEVTPFGTVWDFEKGRKYSVTGDDLYSAVAILDPELTLGLPEEVTISSGLDAISHALESTWNHNANPVTLAYSTRSLQLSLPALPKLKGNPDDIEARGAMMQASLLAGLAISQTRTALAHSISYPITTEFNLPHGIACSFTLPAILEFNAAVDDGRLHDLARAMGCSDVAGLGSTLLGLFRQVGIAGLFGRYVGDAQQVKALTDRMISPGRAGNNLRQVEHDDVARILDNVLAQIETHYA